ncbi:MAG: homoserine kinase [Chloroflexi bacterium]|jgi:homoserine kinase|nr:homoserine kinase [Anaerolineaceae bacterium]NMB89746.1 homoserine kinase [Chloroflexota bacterium]
MEETITIRVPATSANLGPGFDCLAMALDLWNESTWTRTERGIQVEIRGAGALEIPRDSRNLAIQSAMHLFNLRGETPPDGLLVQCDNHIPPGSGLGSSAAAVLSGLLAANAMLEAPLPDEDILNIAAEIEGHADNAAAALYGGLILAAHLEKGWHVQRYIIPSLDIVVVVPKMDLPTHAARSALPATLPFQDAVFNIGRTALVIEAIRSGDLDHLDELMEDRLHLPYRLKLIPGGAAALQAARKAGACAATLSGAGPGLIAFARGNQAEIAQAMQSTLNSHGIEVESFILHSTLYGAGIVRTPIQFNG